MRGHAPWTALLVILSRSSCRIGWIAVLILFLVLPFINACTPIVIMTAGGTNYDEKIAKLNRDTSREEVHKSLGEPISAETYGSPVDSKDIRATWPCCPNPDCSAVEQAQRYRKILGFEVFNIGRPVQTDPNRVGNAMSSLTLDVMTLGLAELVTFPMVVFSLIYQPERGPERTLTIWYGTSNTFEGGEIRYSPMGEHTTFVPYCVRADFSK